ncbi:MAG: DNA repair protein RadA, partial [Acidimicrobiales bacterium]|nr:DNA repair protein RadA [Acidimicrobiales bacterium]
MAKVRSTYRCAGCGAEGPQWTGRCAGCGAWNTIVEERTAPASAMSALAAPSRALPIADVESEGWAPRPVGIGELDRVLGGGLVAGSV